MRKWMASAAVVLVAMVASGCSEGRAKVTGSVKVDGKPLPIGSVYMESEDGKVNGAGPIGADGTFTVDNAPIGKVKVALIIPAPDVTASPKLPDKTSDLPKIEKMSIETAVLLAKVPAKYKECAKSGLVLDVASGDNQPYQISIKSTDLK